MLVLCCRPEPKYEVHVPSHSFVTPEHTYNDVVRSYSRLYIASDFTHLLANWTQVPLSLLLLTRCLEQYHLCLYEHFSHRHPLYCTLLQLNWCSLMDATCADTVSFCLGVECNTHGSDPIDI